jgi:hypothetical protein
MLDSVKSRQSRGHRKEQLDRRTLYLQAPPAPRLLIPSSSDRRLKKSSYYVFLASKWVSESIETHLFRLTREKQMQKTLHLLAARNAAAAGSYSFLIGPSTVLENLLLSLPILVQDLFNLTTFNEQNKKQIPKKTLYLLAALEQLQAPPPVGGGPGASASGGSSRRGCTARSRRRRRA